LSSSLRATAFRVCLGLLAVLTACRPEIGDKCQVSTDCSVRGDRLCDTSQPGGYCTQFNCRANSCPDQAGCVLFNAAIPGCGYDDRSGPFGSRVARGSCIARCGSNSDCRTEDGYVCADPRQPPWRALVLDDDQSIKVCLVIPVEGLEGGAPVAAGTAPVCGPAAPIPPAIDAGPAKIYDAGGPPPLVQDAATDAKLDAGDGGG
jgi:hypothetical protein